MSILAFQTLPLDSAPMSGHKATPPKPEHRYEHGDCLTKVTVNLVPQSVDALYEASKLTMDTKTDVINRAIQLYAWYEQKARAGCQLRLVDHHGNTSEVKLS